MDGIDYSFGIKDRSDWKMIYRTWSIFIHLSNQ